MEAVATELQNTRVLALLQDWQRSVRPLFIVDEVRFTDAAEPGEEYVSFVFVETNTAMACAFAQEALELREKLPAQQQFIVFKGERLFGSRQKASHNPFRAHFVDMVRRCVGAMRVTVSGSILRELSTSAPSRIRTEPAVDGDGVSGTIQGRELGSFLNMCKLVALYRQVGDSTVDVLVDRSRALGLDARSVGIKENQFQVFEPDTLNETAGGKPSSIHCPTRFRLISTPEEGLFQDLLLLPDGLGYLMRQAGSFDAAKIAVRRERKPWVEEVTDLARSLIVRPV